MAYQPIDVELMREKLLTLDEVREKLEPTEHLSQYDFTADGVDKVSFDFPDHWGMNLDKVDDHTVTEATVTVNGLTLPMTKNAVLQATTAVGLADKYVQNSPGELIAMNMNYWYQHGTKRQRMLASNVAAVAFTRETITPYSNIALLDSVVEGIENLYDTNDILVDYKFHHDLKKTKMRLVIPSHSRTIGSARASQAGDDPWSVGIEINNSLIGASSTEIQGYLFAWWCTNGCTTDHVTSGKYRRRQRADVNDVNDWARSVVDDVLGGLEHELDNVEALTQIPLEGVLNDTLGNMFDSFQVPTHQRDSVMMNLAESDDLTAYGLMNSITAVANESDLSSGAVAALMSAGGQVSHALADRCESCHRFG